MVEEKNAAQEFGFNPAWWIGASIAFVLAAIISALTTTLSMFWIFSFLALGMLCAVIGVTGIVHGKGYVFQSPFRLSADKYPRGTVIDWANSLLLLITLIAIFMVGTLVGTVRREASAPSPLDEYRAKQEKKTRDEKQIPEPFSEDDQAILKNALSVPDYRKGEYRFQIIREADDRCRKFAESLSLVLKNSKWIETTPIADPAPGYALPLGITVRSGTVAPAASAAIYLYMSLKALGIHPEDEQDPELRVYNYVVIYVSDHGYLRKE